MFEICISLAWGLCSEAALTKRFDDCMEPKLIHLAADTPPGLRRLGEPDYLARQAISSFVEMYQLGGLERMHVFASNLEERWASSGGDAHPVLVSVVDCFKAM
jgi:hypothetical protein